MAEMRSLGAKIYKHPLDPEQADMQAEELFNRVRPLLMNQHPQAVELLMVEFVARMLSKFKTPDAREAFLTMFFAKVAERELEFSQQHRS